ncbi:serine hydrolase domain-containing protein [Caproiciproducens faecalis]|uniref:Serine hydrolase n=1 Tax=Caproiciproducens faecalis TaxID=2820301 RepID=A0ABS7DP46_9FIRM|nr:serine hydrolase [Caproiciproducens faecalis]MBW7573090.1 serine hydrolase [Caproiciproducens faecalis]
MLDLLSQMKTVDLVIKFVRGDMRRITPYPFQPQKKKNTPKTDLGGIPASTPENEGIPSEYIEQFFEELSDSPDVRPHSVMLLRHGKLIAQGSFKPYSPAYPHMMFSLSKSITGMAVGIAIEEGLLSLDEKIIDIFPEKGVMFRSPRINNITVRHLLNMTSGIKFNEAGSFVEKDWVRAYLLSDCVFEPGSEFSYNSMNSYLLSAIVRKKSGMGLVEYLTPRLFAPLGIEDVDWETCPLGIEKGGWGLFLHIADMAKLGQLYLQGGRWEVEGQMKQLIPEEWIRESTRVQTPPRESGRPVGYGYQVWDFRASDAYQYNGVFGQYVIVLPKHDMVVAITSGSQNLFSDGSTELVEKYFGDDAEKIFDRPLPRNIRALRSLKDRLDSLYAVPETAPKPRKTGLFSAFLQRFFPTKAEKLPLLAAGIDKREYRLGNSYGALLPLILQCVTNNFSGGITRVSFSFEPDLCKITLYDGNDENGILAGLDGVPRRSDVTLNGDVYTVGATAKLTTDEEDRTVMILYLSYMETPCLRVMKFIFYGEKLLIRFYEHPTVEAATKMLFGLVGGSGNNIDKMLIDAISQERMAARVDNIMRPRAKGTVFGKT